MMPEDMFFTRIKEPKLFRTQILESSKGFISVLKDHHVLMELRKTKKDKISELQQHFQELNGLLEKLDTFLPEESIKELEKLMPKQEKPKQQGGRKRRKEKTENNGEISELDKLEGALSEIEGKLQNV